MELKKYKLGDIAEILISSIDKKSKEGESPVKLCNFVDVYHNWAITADMVGNFMESTTSEKNIDRFSLKKGYVAFTKDSETRDDIGVPTYIAEDLDNTVLGYHCALVKPDENIISGKYLNAFLHSDYIKRYFELNATGSGMRYTLSVDTLYNIPILAPSLDIQKRIGDLFSNIDRKICINRSLNHYLEAMAKQLYDYWFVQFDFPNENGKPYKSSGGKMVWNDRLKREIPLGWDSMTIGEYAPCKGGYAFKSSSFCEEGIPVIKIGNIQEDYTLNMSDSQCISDFTNVSYFAQRYDLVIAMTGATIGKFAVSQREYLINQRVGRFDLGNNPISKLGYILNSLKQDYFREQIFQISGGCAQPNISSDQIDSIVILKPDTSLLSEFNERCESLISQQSELLLQIEHLITLRNEILPLLMNGAYSGAMSAR